MSRSQAAGAVLLGLVAIAGLWIDARMFLAAWLAAWWWCLGLVLGCFVNAWMHRLTGGAWGEPIRATALLLAHRMPLLLPGLVPVALGLAVLYPWTADPQGEWLKSFARPAFVHVWLSRPFFLARLVGYALAWWWLARPASLASKGRAAAALVLHTGLTSLAAVDLLMSLLPGWYSTAFGLVTLSAQALAGAAAAIVFAALRQPAQSARARGGVPVSRDLGNLVLMWVMTWAYLAFMQFLIIWAENLPREIAWYVPRLRTGWQWIGLAIVLLQLAVPFVALLLRSVKDSPRQLCAVAGLVLFACALDAAWLVLPSVNAHNLHGWWLLPLALAGMSLLVFGNLPAGTRSEPGDATAEGVRHARP